MDLTTAKAKIRYLMREKGYNPASAPWKVEELARELMQREEEKRAQLGPSND